MTILDGAVLCFGLWCFKRLIRVLDEQAEAERWHWIKTDRIKNEVWIARLHDFGIETFHGRVMLRRVR